MCSTCRTAAPLYRFVAEIQAASASAETQEMVGIINGRLLIADTAADVYNS